MKFLLIFRKQCRESRLEMNGTRRFYGKLLKSGLGIREQQIQSPMPSTAYSELKGRDLVSFETYTTGDIHTLLWIAMDLKQRQTGKMAPGKSIFMISDDPIRRISLSHAASKLGASVAFGNFTDHLKTLDLGLFGKTLASASDIIFVDTNKINLEETQKLATGCTVPVVSVLNSELSPVLCLAELMTLFEEYKYLRRLTISYIGIEKDSTLNTYAVLLPKVGMHLRFLIEGTMKSELWEQGIQLSIQLNTELKQSDNLAGALYRSHVISTCPESEWKLTMKDVEEMHLDWTVLHSQPYKGCVIAEDMLRSKNSLVWKTISNLTWIFQAIVAAKTTNYKPIIQRPEFEGLP